MKVIVHVQITRVTISIYHSYVFPYTIFFERNLFINSLANIV